MLLRLPESQLKTHLPMRVDKLKKVGRLPRRSRSISRAIAVAQSQIRQGWQGIERSWQTYNQLSKRVPGEKSLITLLHSDKSWSFGKCVSILWNSSAQGQTLSEGQRRWQRCECCQDLLQLWCGHMSSQCPKMKALRWKNHHCESCGQPRHNHVWIGRKLLRCWQRE